MTIEAVQLPPAIPASASVTIGGLIIAVVDRKDAARDMIARSRQRRSAGPLYYTSANGEVIARTSADPSLKALFAKADQIVADGQPLVTASRFLCAQALPERVATTDLFHDVAKLAELSETTFYMLGASPAENDRAVARTRERYPRLNIVGASHGYLEGEALEQKLAEINALAPDILWLCLGVPREQIFYRDNALKLTNVGIVKTAGGLFDHIAGKTIRAPLWLQKAGFEWLWRMLMEPRRLFWRYLTTNPRAVWAMLRDSR
jgi:N-acetylglucosaminyldiphosphoundecaprenol N-acetyl-beta-D-mannosaminyltransferase